MKIDAVKLMRDARDRISEDTKGMTWAEEQQYLRTRIKEFAFLARETPNKSLQPTLASLPLRRVG